MAAGGSTAAFATPNGCSAARLSKEARPRTAGARSSCFPPFRPRMSPSMTIGEAWSASEARAPATSENYRLPEDLTFVWDLLKPKPRRGGPSYLFPPFSYVAKEHGSVAIGAARRALDELIQIATTTRGTFRSSRLDERQVVHRRIAEADLKLRAA